MTGTNHRLDPTLTVNFRNDIVEAYPLHWVASVGGGHPARIDELVGHGDIVTTARTDMHVVADGAELGYVELLA